MTASENFFVVGSHYTNRKGSYEVLDVQHNGMRVKYESGEIQIIQDLAQQERIVTNIHSQAAYAITAQAAADAKAAKAPKKPRKTAAPKAAAKTAAPKAAKTAAPKRAAKPKAAAKTAPPESEA